MNRGRAPTLWKQSFPFSCGPAALGSVLVSLGWRPSGDPTREEVEMWRESTAVACPGAHPFGLALAARRRGFGCGAVVSGPRPWLWSHIRSGHAIAQRREYAAIERRLESQCGDHAVAIRGSTPANRAAGPGLLLVSAREEPGAQPDPHWVGILPAPDGLWILDPLRSSAYRSHRPFSEWWARSGFEGTRTWIAIRPPPSHRRMGRSRQPRGASARAPAHRASRGGQ